MSAILKFDMIFIISLLLNAPRYFERFQLELELSR